MENSEPGCLLRKEESGEHYLLLVFFLKECGLIQLLVRKRQKSAMGIIIPDLFDLGIVTWEQKGPARPAFLKDFEPEIHHSGIARNYNSLKAAARLSRFYEKNLLHMETFNEAWDVLVRSLAAISSGYLPEIVLFKAFFVIARTEGYSVSSGWLLQLPTDMRLSVQQSLRAPAMEASVDRATVEEWIRRLLIFFETETDLLPPD